MLRMPRRMGTALRISRFLCYALTALAALVAIHRSIVPLASRTVAIEASDIKDADRHGMRLPLKSQRGGTEVDGRFATVLENGRPLPYWVPSIADVASAGHGRFCVTAKNIWFSATDGSDPRQNGKRYAVRLPLAVPRPIWLLLAGGALGLWIALAAIPAGRTLFAGDWEPWKRRMTSRAGFWSVVALLLLGRLLLASQDEIIASTADPADFVSLASHGYYGAPVTALSRPAVYPLFLALVDTTGISLRIAIEIVQGLCFALFACACLRCGVSRLATLAVFGSMVLAPQTLSVNDYAFADTLYAPLLVAAAGLGLIAVTSDRWWMGAPCGVALGLLMHLREEGILIVGLGMVLAFFLALGAPPTSKATPAARFRFRFAKPVALVAAAALVDGAFTLAFHSKTGVWARSRLNTPGMASLMRGFHSIPSDDPAQRFFVVNARARERAYALSPFLNHHREDYESDPIKREWIKHAGVADLSGDALIWRSLSIFAAPAGENLRGVEAHMKAVGEELITGLGQNKQRVYWAAACSVNDATLAVLARHWRSLFADAARAAFALPPGQVVDPVATVATDDATRERIDLYNGVTNRRSVLAARLDTTGVIRSRSIQSAWEWVHRLQNLALGLLAVAVAGVVLWKVAAARRPVRCAAHWWTDPRLQLILTLACLAGSKLLFACLMGVYFAIVPRYMLPLSLTALPLLLLTLDRLAASDAAGSPVPAGAPR